MTRAVILDIDGVLTDGRVLIGPDGTESKLVNFEDIDGYFALRRAGFKLGFITGEDTPFAEFVRRRFAPDFLVTGAKDKLGAFKDLSSREGFTAENACFLGDSAKDVPLLELLSSSFCPSDSPDNVKDAAKTVLRAKRGDGAIAELASRLLAPEAGESEAYYLSKIDEHIGAVRLLRSDGEAVAAIKKAGDILAESLSKGGKMLICGNGGSAADSQHIATELVSRFLAERRGIAAEALSTNTSSLTAIGNDYGFEHVFRRQVEANGREGDVLVGITTSGNSPNVILAMEQARKMSIKTVGLTGAREGTKMEGVSDCLIRVPSNHTPVIQECHILIGHMLCGHIEQTLFKRTDK